MINITVGFFLQSPTFAVGRREIENILIYSLLQRTCLKSKM